MTCTSGSILREGSELAIEFSKEEVAMRRLGYLALALALGAPACGSSNNNNPSQQPIIFTAQLRTANEVPPLANASEANAQGSVTITFNVPRDSSGNVTGDGTWNVQAVVSGFPEGSTIILAHIHMVLRACRLGSSSTPGRPQR